MFAHELAESLTDDGTTARPFKILAQIGNSTDFALQDVVTVRLPRATPEIHADKSVVLLSRNAEQILRATTEELKALTLDEVYDILVTVEPKTEVRVSYGTAAGHDSPPDDPICAEDQIYSVRDITGTLALCPKLWVDALVDSAVQRKLPEYHNTIY